MKQLSALLAVALLAVSSACFAAKGEFGDLCVTGLAMGHEVPTNCSLNMTVGDKTYCFSGDEAKQMFMKDQDKMTMKAEENFKKMMMKK